jgi:hypothetical protein
VVANAALASTSSVAVQVVHPGFGSGVSVVNEAWFAIDTPAGTAASTSVTIDNVITWPGAMVLSEHVTMLSESTAHRESL